MPTQTAPHGAWPSPITPELVMGGARRVTELCADGDALCWLESRPDEGGRVVVVRRERDGTTRDVTPPGTNVRTRVHEYGGGAYLVHDATTWFCDFADQRIMRIEPGRTEAVAITPDTGSRVRYAEMTPTPDGTHLICVRETHHGDDATDVVNELVAVPADGDGEMVVLASGRDFVANPAISPDGSQLAWITWDHPNMPFFSTEAVLADLDGLVVSNVRTVAGGDAPGTPEDGEAAWTPRFDADGRLHLLTDRSGWWNLHRVADDGTLTNVAPVHVELGQPGWALGQRIWDFLADGRIAVIATDHAVERPSILDPASGDLTPLGDTTSCRSLVVAGDAVWFAGASPTAFTGISRADAATGDVEEVHRVRDVPVDAGWLPVPQAVTFPTGDGTEVAHAFWYPPTNPDVRGPDGELPPVVVSSHGGPTSSNAPQLAMGTAWWTSRGFGVVDVNYRGSTGFGRAYRQGLDDRWGIADVEDCVAVVTHLAAEGLADGGRAVVRGGSASGYTTLCALVFTDAFAAGSSHYGVADPALLARHTHKFESRYLDGLIGRYPEDAEVYEARSPLAHAERITVPVVLFQGLEDKVVPPEQAEAMAAALTDNGIAHAYIAFPGEQHGFRDAANIITTMTAELSFCCQVLGIPHPDDIPVLNLSRPQD